MVKAYIDTDVILDLLQKRERFFDDAARIFVLLENGKARGYVSPLIFANLYYLLRKERGAKPALDALLRLKMLLRVLTIGDKAVQLALSSAFRDFEDALQYYAAVEHGLDCLITRNKKDYRGEDIPVYLPGEFLELIEQ
ncbi:MAG: PIN domain-containing protein [Candidatus Nealsonbacteria bacterium]|nr:PIN domain-containing protein [Candidatus Nealsonbacteria bacterium]